MHPQPSSMLLKGCRFRSLGGIQTHNRQITHLVLYQFSYWGDCFPLHFHGMQLYRTLGDCVLVGSHASWGTRLPLSLA